MYVVPTYSLSNSTICAFVYGRRFLRELLGLDPDTDDVIFLVGVRDDVTGAWLTSDDCDDAGDDVISSVTHI